MNFEKLRKLKIDNRLKINEQILQIVDIRPELHVIEYYLLDEKTKLEFMLQVPEEKNDEEMFHFYKIFRHGRDTKCISVGFKKHVEIL